MYTSSKRRASVLLRNRWKSLTLLSLLKINYRKAINKSTFKIPKCKHKLCDEHMLTDRQKIPKESLWLSREGIRKNKGTFIQWMVVKSWPFSLGSNFNGQDSLMQKEERISSMNRSYAKALPNPQAWLTCREVKICVLKALHDASCSFLKSNYQCSPCKCATGQNSTRGTSTVVKLIRLILKLSYKMPTCMCVHLWWWRVLCLAS